MRFLFVASIVPIFVALVACSDRENPDSDGSSSGGKSSSGEQSSSSSSSGGSSSSSSGSSGGPRNFACPTGTREKTLRIVAGNISNGNAQSYDDGSGLRIFKALAPDIALVQEMNYGSNSADDHAAFVATGFGDGYSYQRGANVANGSISNGVVTRFPILDEGEEIDTQVGGTRTYVWARVNVPGDRDVLAISVHFSTDAGKRTTEANEVNAMVDALHRDSDLVVLGGDFNTDTRESEGVSTLSARFVTTGPYPSDEDGNDGTNTNRLLEGKDKPYDWVVGDSALAERSRRTTIGPIEFLDGLVFDSRVFSDLSLMPGVLQTDSELHQHMAVARTFAVCE